mgnify:CR=1 FL=1
MDDEGPDEMYEMRGGAEDDRALGEALSSDMDEGVSGEGAGDTGGGVAGVGDLQAAIGATELEAGDSQGSTTGRSGGGGAAGDDRAVGAAGEGVGVRPAGRFGWRSQASRRAALLKGEAAGQASAETWAAYLAGVAEHASKWLSAERVGLPWRLVRQRLDEDEAFRDEFVHAIEVRIERLEELLVAPGLEKRNVVGLIVRLKAMLPDRYIERQVSMAVSVRTEVKVTPEEAKALLASLMKDAQPQTVRMLTGGKGEDA